MLNKVLAAFCLLLTSLPLMAYQPGDQFNARVTWVHNGNTFTVTTGHVLERNLKQWRIRLADLDAPEKDQPFGAQATSALRDLVMTREVVLKVLDVDRHDRLVVRAYVLRHGEVVDVNHELVRLGLAWVFKQFLHDRSLQAVENEAKDARRGLWAETDPVPPWEWRRTR